MTENKLYDTLLALPLFLGMSRNDLREAAGMAKFDFLKYKEGELIIEEGMPCQHLFFLLSGNIDVITESDDHAYRIKEDITAPEIFQIEHLFGLSTRFTHTYHAQSACSLMSIEKAEILKLSKKFDIFYINLINLISTQTQKMNRRLLHVPPKTLEERIVRFLESHCLRPAGKKDIYIKMTRIAEELNDSRLDISRALNRMKAQGTIQLGRGKIHIPAMEKLINR